MKQLTLFLPQERCVCDIISELRLEQANVSQHLAVLRRENLIKSRKQGLQVMYRIKHLEIMALLEKAQEIICSELDSSSRLIRGMAQAGKIIVT